MERRGPKVRKTDYIVEEEHEEETHIQDSGNANAKRKTPLRKDDTAVNVEDPLINPQLGGDQVRREQRKRHAPAPDVAPPKKPAPPLVTEQATAETDQSSVDDVFMLEVENLTIDQSGRDYRLEGARPKTRPKVLVSRERSEYVIAQASFLSASSESVSSGSRENVPGKSSKVVTSRSGADVVGSGASRSGASGAGRSGGSGASASSGSGSGVPILEIDEILPVITIDAAEERYANIIAKYNDMVPFIRHRFTSYRNIYETLPELIENTRHNHLMVYYSPKSTPEMKSACSMVYYNLVCIEENLQEDMTYLNTRLNECSTIAEKIMRIYPADHTLPQTIILTEEVCQLLNMLEKGLEIVLRLLKRYKREISKYNEQRPRLDMLF